MRQKVWLLALMACFLAGAYQPVAAHHTPPGCSPWPHPYHYHRPKPGLFGCVIAQNLCHILDCLHHCCPCPIQLHCEPPCPPPPPCMVPYAPVIVGMVVPAPIVSPVVPQKEQEDKDKDKKEKETSPRKSGKSAVEQTVSLSRQLQADRLQRDRGITQVRARKIDLSGLAPKDATRLFWNGYRLYWQGKYSDALAFFEAAVQLQEKDARFWYFRSLTESALGESSRADESLAKAVDLHVQGLPDQETIGKALERIQGQSRMKLRAALDRHRAR